MAKVEAKREVRGLTASECYQACVSLVELTGYKLFKKRDLANLIICNETIEGQNISLSLMVPFGSPTTINLSLSRDEMDGSAVQVEADRILDIIFSNMKA